MKPLRRILVPIELASVCDAAVEHAVALAKRYEAELVVFHAYEPPGYVYPTLGVDALALTFEAVADAATAGVKAMVDRLRERNAAVRVRGLIEQGSPRERILEAISRLDCDLVVMGTHGRRGLARALLGSVAEEVVRRSPVPVMTVHPQQAA